MLKFKNRLKCTNEDKQRFLCIRAWKVPRVSPRIESCESNTIPSTSIFIIHTLMNVSLMEKMYFVLTSQLTYNSLSHFMYCSVAVLPSEVSYMTHAKVCSVAARILESSTGVRVLASSICLSMRSLSQHKLISVLITNNNKMNKLLKICFISGLPFKE